jgi:hypothetical protein
VANSNMESKAGCSSRAVRWLILVLVTGALGCASNGQSAPAIKNQDMLRSLLVSGGDPARCRPMSGAEMYAIESQRHTNMLGSRAMPSCGYPSMGGR